MFIWCISFVTYMLALKVCVCSEYCIAGVQGTRGYIPIYAACHKQQRFLLEFMHALINNLGFNHFQIATTHGTCWNQCTTTSATSSSSSQDRPLSPFPARCWSEDFRSLPEGGWFLIFQLFKTSSSTTSSAASGRLHLWRCFWFLPFSCSFFFSWSSSLRPIIITLKIQPQIRLILHLQDTLCSFLQLDERKCQSESTKCEKS